MDFLAGRHGEAGRSGLVAALAGAKRERPKGVLRYYGNVYGWVAVVLLEAVDNLLS